MIFSGVNSGATCLRPQAMRSASTSVRAVLKPVGYFSWSSASAAQVKRRGYDLPSSRIAPSPLRGFVPCINHLLRGEGDGAGDLQGDRQLGDRVGSTGDFVVLHESGEGQYGSTSVGEDDLEVAPGAVLPVGEEALLLDRGR